MPVAAYFFIAGWFLLMVYGFRIIRVMAERGLDTANVRLLMTMIKRAGACLRNLQRQGGATRQPGAGQFMLWELARS